jgi:CBS domain-containing protein/sporulation protein YlmC with PRC-barrel domain
MAFLSELVGKPVYDSQDRRLGLLEDVCIPAQQARPRVSAIRVGQRWIPWRQVERIEGVAQLKVAEPEVLDYSLKPHDVRLREEVLDHQVVDIPRRAVRRVNDVTLSQQNGHCLLEGVDLTRHGLLRRLRVRREAGDGLLAWTDVDPVHSHTTSGVRLRRSREAMARLHPADLAAIVEELSPGEALVLFDKLGPELAAAALDHLDEERRTELLEDMDSGQAASLLRHMAPDVAADAMAAMDPGKAAKAAALMDADAYETLSGLLGHDDDCAGGLMTTDYVAVLEDVTVAAALDHVRAASRDTDMVYDVYAVRDLSGRWLAGSLTLRELLLASASARVADVMHRQPIRVPLDERLKTVAQTMAKYRLTSLPVVDTAGQLQGVVTVDDVLERLLPSAWKRRLARDLAPPS